MTPDLARLKEHLDALSTIVEGLELELVEDPRWAQPSDTSYLRPADRANPDILANLEAMSETNELIDWFGRDAEGYVGLWRGPTGTPRETAPVARLDTEGQYSIVAATIADYLAISVAKRAFEETVRALSAVGFEVSESREAIWARIGSAKEANSYRHTRYNEARVRRGLPAI